MCEFCGALLRHSPAQLPGQCGDERQGLIHRADPDREVFSELGHWGLVVLLCSLIGGACGGGRGDQGLCSSDDCALRPVMLLPWVRAVAAPSGLVRLAASARVQAPAVSGPGGSGTW